MQIQKTGRFSLVIAVLIAVGLLGTASLIVCVWFLLSRPAKAPTIGQINHSQPPSFNKQKYSLDDPASIWVVVNKTRPLKPVTYAPTDLTNPNTPLRLNASADEMHLRQAAAEALQRLVVSAKSQGVNLMLASGYRSYTTQVQVYNSYVKNDGRAKADKESARPGYSEHQTGLAVDVSPSSGKCLLDQCFGDTLEGKWLTAHAYQFGFIIRYPADKTAVTGYEYEPWHIRYIGTELSNEMHNQGITTLEEFFGLPAAPNYV